MNVLDELRSLDLNDPGRWPPGFRATAVVSIFLAVAVLGGQTFVINAELALLAQADLAERELSTAFEQKHERTANLDHYRLQLAEIERSFGTVLRQLPATAEVPELLADISEAGRNAGLEEQLFQPLDEVRTEFYAELPINIRLRGDYHQFGAFVSDIAALPRIATLHDIHIRPVNPGDPRDLLLDITARTYRHLDGGGQGP